MKKKNLHLKLSKLFKEKKCCTIEELSKSLDYSIISVRIYLKKIGYYSSFTHNNKWYTLKRIPSFDEQGLWFYKKIGFSKHGNLNQTILNFINRSSQGLSAKKISEIILQPCHSVLNMMYTKGKIDRINTKSGYVYLSIDEKKRAQQTDIVLKSKESPFPSDADAVQIFVKLIKNPDYTADELVSSLKGKIITKNPESIKRLLRYHKLEKKTSRPLKKFF